ncbi:hypothetical protein Ahia01_001364000 [Argonauta hians]
MEDAAPREGDVDIMKLAEETVLREARHKSRPRKGGGGGGGDPPGSQGLPTQHQKQQQQQQQRTTTTTTTTTTADTTTNNTTMTADTTTTTTTAINCSPTRDSPAPPLGKAASGDGGSGVGGSPGETPKRGGLESADSLEDITSTTSSTATTTATTPSPSSPTTNPTTATTPPSPSSSSTLAGDVKSSSSLCNDHHHHHRDTSCSGGGGGGGRTPQRSLQRNNSSSNSSSNNNNNNSSSNNSNNNNNMCKMNRRSSSSGSVNSGNNNNNNNNSNNNATMQLTSPPSPQPLPPPLSSAGESCMSSTDCLTFAKVVTPMPRYNISSRKRFEVGHAGHDSPCDIYSYLTPTQRKEQQMKELRHQIKVMAKRIEEKDRDIDILKGEKGVETARAFEEQSQQIQKVRDEMLEMQLKNEQLVQDCSDAQHCIKQLQAEICALKETVRKSDDDQEKMYLEMYKKGQQSAQFEREEDLQTLLTRGVNNVGIRELARRLAWTECELAKWQTIQRKEAYESADKPSTEAAATLRFLKDSFFHYLTNEKDSDDHLRAMIRIFNYTEVQRKKVARNLLEGKKLRK